MVRKLRSMEGRVARGTLQKFTKVSANNSYSKMFFLLPECKDFDPQCNFIKLDFLNILKCTVLALIMP